MTVELKGGVYFKNILNQHLSIFSSISSRTLECLKSRNCLDNKTCANLSCVTFVALNFGRILLDIKIKDISKNTLSSLQLTP